MPIILEKLHFITLNYTLDYTIRPKLFKCTFCTLNYDPSYTLHPDVKFAVNLNGNPKFMVQSVIERV